MEVANSSSDQFFNDLSQGLPATDTYQSQTSENTGAAQGEGDGNSVPRPKRIACVVCRKRKLRCDGKKPSCGTCSRLGHDCAYDEVRKKSGPKRGYVKQLEARLAQVETLLKSQDPEPPRASAPNRQQSSTFNDTSIPSDPMPGMPDMSMFSDNIPNSMPSLAGTFGQTQSGSTGLAGENMGFNGDFSWEMISLGLEEPLPAQDVIDELHQIYFDKVHPSSPIIHRPRYLAAMNLAPHTRPPVCLRYIMWCHAASVSSKYSFLQEHFYQRARKYAEADEMKGQGEAITTVAYSQAWSLIAAYEFKMLFFPRAWASAGKASRLSLMTGLHRLDGTGLDTKQCIGPPRDWTEREERRRAFWLAFCQDRYASIGTGWPMMLDERDILTNLPASEDAYIHGRPEKTPSLSEVVAGEGLANMSPFAGVIVTASFFGRHLMHLHRPEPNDNDHDLNGEFWKRHRAYDNIILNTALSLPAHLRLPAGINDPNIVFCNMCIHTSTVCLHQAAIFKADKNQMPSQIAAESKRRCIIAADQVASIMKMISHTDLSTMNTFICFPLYVASRVFVQYLKSRPNDQTVRSTLHFLLSALNAIKHMNPLTESFLIQLKVDLGGTIMETPDIAVKTSCGMKGKSNASGSAGGCSPLVPFENSQQSQKSGSTVESPLSGETLLDNPGSYGQSGINPSAIPNRQKQLGIQQFNTSLGLSGMELPVRRQASGNSSPSMETIGYRINGDMDVSSDMSVSDRNQPSSDHPTPSTQNSSSNTSYGVSGADYPSPQKHQRSSTTASNMHPNSSVDPSVRNIAMPSDNQSYLTEVSSSVNYFAPDGGNAGGLTGSENPFAMPAAWDYPLNQGSPENIEVVGGMSGMTPTESQWTQMLEGASWENWRT
ncbi:transcriptional regulator family: Fungal Specific TF [Paecilomyces variotii]|nr:transcriptional regulator family: Fungal Specific TF [Paecilomyces variotii]KAJ9372655.1 transcriptional regulator family: Fungal Specific TF [Paecilomyces variotii]